MATYTMFWPQWMCDRAREQGLEGQPLRMLWGGHNQDTRFSRFKVGPGDTVVPIASVDGVLYALGSLEVKEKTSGSAWLARNPGDEKLKLHGCGDELLVGAPGAPLRFDRAFSGPQLTKWRYDGTDGERPLKFLEKGRLKKTMSLQGVYRVTPATAKLIASVLALEAPAKKKSTSTDLEASLRAAPADEQLARVLADAWQDAGDARGELLALELDLAKEREPRRALELDARHAKLMRSAGMKKQPGGFPYRVAMGGRSYELVAGDAPLAAVGAEALVAACFELTKRLLDVEGLGKLELLRTPGLREPPAPLSKRLDAIGAERTAFVTWTRKEPFSVAELLGAMAGEPAFIIGASGAVRGSDGGAALPFQSGSQWVGTPLSSELELNVPARRVRMTLRVPLGCPLAERRVEELGAMLKSLGVEPRVRRLRREASGRDVA